MKIKNNKYVTPDPWHGLKKYTDARIGVGRSGTSLPLAESLAFKLDHARARDTVLQPLDVSQLVEQFTLRGHAPLLLHSAVNDRKEYLTRPDKGRILNDESRKLVRDHARPADIVLIAGDGLSSKAIHANAVDLAVGLLDIFKYIGLSIAPFCLVENARVAIADEIGGLFSSRVSVILIGERPGLSSPDSLGIYITYNPKPGTTDEARNCMSNIRNGGLSLMQAILKCSYIIETALKLHKTGVVLKDRMDKHYLPFGIGHEQLTAMLNTPLH